MFALTITLVLLSLLSMFLISLYNNLVSLRNKLRNGFAQIDVQLKRRHDLIPNLVETARGYLNHERSTLEALVNARNAAQSAGQVLAQSPGDATALAGMMQAESQLSQSLGRFFAVAEAYPDLKANSTLMQLSEELTTTENKVAFARQAYNDAVMLFNTAAQSFPAVLFAAALGFHATHPLQAIEAETERQVPTVRL